ncbi:MAG TPA: heme exporter protein CcmD [Steroidobacteraceae bacterium]|nr:heme exporter protein CcmD [Steroidobacteraceae bacterium]
MKTFLDMGGYAAFVWPAYAVTFTVVFLNIFWARRALARSRAEARRRIAMRAEQA